MLARLIVRQRARGSPLGSRREERREAPEAGRYPVVGFVTDKRYELGRRLAGGVEGPSIAFLPNLPRNKHRLIPAVRPSEQAAREGELLKLQVVNKAPEAAHESPV